MALWMEAGAEPLTDKEKDDLNAISALKESAAIELKEKGNEYVKKGKKHYQDAIDCYTRAINQGALGEQETSTIFSNRAHVNLLLGNYRRALEDAEQAIKLCPTNVKGYYRAAKAALCLNLLKEASSFCEKAIQLSLENEELKKLAKQVNAKLQEQERREAEVSKALTSAKDLISAFESRGLKLGKSVYRELTGLKRPCLDSSGILHWPVLLLYAEAMSSDFIEEFCETELLSSHLDMMFSDDSPPLPWDIDNAYTREAIEVYYEVGSVPCLSRAGVLRYLLEGTAAADHESISEEKESNTNSHPGKGESKWVKVNQRRTLHDVMKEPDFVIPGIPVFYVVSKKSTSFYKDFKAGKWTLPQLRDYDAE